MDKNEGSVFKKEAVVNSSGTALLRDRYKYSEVLGERFDILVHYDYRALVVDVRPVERHFGLESFRKMAGLKKIGHTELVLFLVGSIPSGVHLHLRNMLAVT